jgi:hypothetical protein
VEEPATDGLFVLTGEGRRSATVRAPRSIEHVLREVANMLAVTHQAQEQADEGPLCAVKDISHRDHGGHGVW